MYTTSPLRLNSLPKRVPAVTGDIVASGANVVFGAKFETAFEEWCERTLTKSTRGSRTVPVCCRYDSKTDSTFKIFWRKNTSPPTSNEGVVVSHRSRFSACEEVTRLDVACARINHIADCYNCPQKDRPSSEEYSPNLLFTGIRVQHPDTTHGAGARSFGVSHYPSQKKYGADQGQLATLGAGSRRNWVRS